MKWWGYQHTEGGIYLQQYHGNESEYKDCAGNYFVKRLVEPFDAADKKRALTVLTRRLDVLRVKDNEAAKVQGATTGRFHAGKYNVANVPKVDKSIRTLVKPGNKPKLIKKIDKAHKLTARSTLLFDDIAGLAVI